MSAKAKEYLTLWVRMIERKKVGRWALYRIDSSRKRLDQIAHMLSMNSVSGEDEADPETKRTVKQARVIETLVLPPGEAPNGSVDTGR